jgi:hypothetical protein
MGRLTLNVFLSFAQSEREVTGERIRDKIAASKRKGMWMGGNAPFGYDAKDRKLLVNSSEAKVVREIYRQYLKLGCVSKLKIHLERNGIRSKKLPSSTGRMAGGRSLFSRCNLQHPPEPDLSWGNRAQGAGLSRRARRDRAACTLGAGAGAAASQRSRPQEPLARSCAKLAGRFRLRRPRKPIHTCPCGQEREEVPILRLPGCDQKSW